MVTILKSSGHWGPGEAIVDDDPPEASELLKRNENKSIAA